MVLPSECGVSMFLVSYENKAYNHVFFFFGFKTMF